MAVVGAGHEVNVGVETEVGVMAGTSVGVNGTAAIFGPSLAFTEQAVMDPHSVPRTIANTIRLITPLLRLSIVLQ
jgi:hypothetical protein